MKVKEFYSLSEIRLALKHFVLVVETLHGRFFVRGAFKDGTEIYLETIGGNVPNDSVFRFDDFREAQKFVSEYVKK